MDEHRGWRRLHLFLQRAALALRRYDPHRCGRWPWRTGSAMCSWARMTGASRCSAGQSSTPAHGAVFGLLRRRPRCLRCSRTRRARERLQCERRRLIAARTRSRATRLSAHGRAGFAWAMLGFAEQLEFFETLRTRNSRLGGRAETVTMMRNAAEATCDFYIENTPPDGIPYWDTGAPGLAKLGDWRCQTRRPVQRP